MGLIEAGLLGDVGEGAVAVVVVERVVMHAGDEDVGMAIVVVVADGHADVEAGAGEAGCVGDVGEFAVAVVAEEAVAIFRRVFFRVAMSAPLVKKISGRPSPL